MKSILERAFFAPDQVDMTTLDRVVETGYFRNRAHHGFQEGYFHKRSEIEMCFRESGYVVEDVLSIRGIGFRNEEDIMKLKVADLPRFEHLLRSIRETSRLPSIVDTAGHAMVIARMTAT